MEPAHKKQKTDPDADPMEPARKKQRTDPDADPDAPNYCSKCGQKLLDPDADPDAPFFCSLCGKRLPPWMDYTTADSEMISEITLHNRFGRDEWGRIAEKYGLTSIEHKSYKQSPKNL